MQITIKMFFEIMLRFFVFFKRNMTRHFRLTSPDFDPGFGLAEMQLTLKPFSLIKLRIKTRRLVLRFYQKAIKAISWTLHLFGLLLTQDKGFWRSTRPFLMNPRAVDSDTRN